MTSVEMLCFAPVLSRQKRNAMGDLGLASTAPAESAPSGGRRPCSKHNFLMRWAGRLLGQTRALYYSCLVITMHVNEIALNRHSQDTTRQARMAH